MEMIEIILWRPEKMKIRKELVKIVDEEYTNKEQAIRRFVSLSQLYEESNINEFERDKELFYRVTAFKVELKGGEYI